jgi:hypothetical protein
MRGFTIGCLWAMTALAVGCGEQAAPITNPDAEAAATRVPAMSMHNFVAPLRGAAEVPPVPTAAVGMSGFHVRPDGASIEYMLLIGRLNNLTQAHIHLGPAGQNGPVVVWLYPSGPPPSPIPGEFNGVLATGVITAANLVGPLAGEPLSVLLDHMRNGNTYVNVHSQQYPPGEIRGQIVGIDILD